MVLYRLFKHIVDLYLYFKINYLKLEATIECFELFGFQKKAENNFYARRTEKLPVYYWSQLYRFEQLRTHIIFFDGSNNYRGYLFMLIY